MYRMNQNGKEKKSNYNNLFSIQLIREVFKLCNTLDFQQLIFVRNLLTAGL